MKILKYLILLISFVANAQDLSHIKEQKAFDVSGGLQTRLNYYDTSDTITSLQPFSYMFTLNVAPSIYGISFPMSIAYSEKNTAFAQPFYRFGISPSYKWIKLNLGHRYARFSQYTVSGLKFLGAGIELQPKKFRFGFIYGSFLRQRNFRTVYPGDDLNTEQYSRRGFAAKIGYGSRNNFFDIILTKISDKNFPPVDSIKFYPQANLVLGMHMRFKITKNTRFEAEAAGSVFTRNLHAAAVNTADLSDFERKWADFSQINTSSYLATVVDARLDQTFKSFKLGLQYKRVDPGYKSMGTYSIRDDYESYMLNLGYNGKKFSINTGIGKARDNLNNQKMAQTNRLITRLNLSYRPVNSFTLQASYNNFSTKQTEGRLPLNDTIRIYQANQTLSIIPQLRLVNKKRAHIILLNYTYTGMTDKNPYSETKIPVQSNVGFVQYNYQNLPGKYGVSFNVTYSSMKSKLTQVTTLGPFLAFQKSFAKNKFSLQTGAGYFRVSANDVNSDITKAQLNLTYKIGKKQYLKLNLITNRNLSAGRSHAYTRNYTRSMLVYGLRF